MVDGPGVTKVMHPNVEDILQTLGQLPRDTAVSVLAEVVLRYRANLLEEAAKARGYAEELLNHATNLEQALEFNGPVVEQPYERL
jgi:hypothetical protein